MKVMCKTRCSYGEKGQVLELEGVSQLTERQLVMLEPYEEPEVKKVAKAEKAK